MNYIPYAAPDLKKYFLTSLVILLIVIFGVFIVNKKLHQLELRDKEIRYKQAYFHLYLHEKVSEIKPLELNQVFLGALNLTLFDALLRIQNDFFDTVQVDTLNHQVFIRVSIPEGVKDTDVQEYINYQALNYVLVLNKLLPDNSFKTIRLNAFRRGAYGSEFQSDFAFQGLLSLQKSSYNNQKILEHQL